LGYGNLATIGDDETPESAGDVPVGGAVVAIAAGANHTCAILGSGSLRCWGQDNGGQLGYGNTLTVGDDESPDAIGDVPLGEPVVAVTAGSSHTCAVLASGLARCWGYGGNGQLGFRAYALGDDEPITSVGPISLGGLATEIAAGTAHTCALLQSGGLRCWGSSPFGQLGYGNTQSIGISELPSSVGYVPVSYPLFPWP
jgi:alpha-tubulin suppressor-like RCC1 family protein